ncbi:MAG: apolipoprotein N-acyltransferase [Pseudonocardiaceae bacterium]
MAVPTVTAGEPVVPAPPTARRPVQALLSLSAAVGAGGLLYACAPPRELWWLAPVAFALLWPTLQARRAQVGFGHGFVFGLGFFVPLLQWTGTFVGALPWLALATVEALVLALAGAGVAGVSRLPAAPLWAAGVWVAAEALIARVPFDGFPWGRVAFGQPAGVFLPLAAIGGAPLLSAAVVLSGFGAGELIRRAVRGQRRGRLAVPALLAASPVVAGLLATGWPLPATVSAGRTGPDNTAVVAVVQGNVPRAGLDFNAQRRAVLDNHGARTEQLAADVAAGRYPRPELVIWPENSSDIDPLRNSDARAVIDRAARAIDAPILVGAVLRNNDGRPTNTAIVWEPETGPGEEHDKRRLQPFGEYLPYREFFRLFSPYVDQAGNFVPGSGDGAVDLGPARVGVATCYEVVFDDLVRQSVLSGATLLAVPTNNATFGFTEMTYQQQAMSRVRAVEHGRVVLVAATSGVSSIIAPDGTVEQQTTLFTPAALVAQVPLRSGTTLATRLGPGPEWGLAALGMLGMALGMAPALKQAHSTGIRTDRRRTAPTKEDVDDGSAG